MGERDDAMWQWSAVEVASAVRGRKVSAEDAVRSVLDRIEQADGRVNAYATVDPDGAISAARQIDAKVKAGEDPGPLAGVAFSVKDLIVTKGMVTDFGSRVFAGNVPDHDAEMVARLRRAGAILVGKSNTPEFGHKALTNNPLHGYTRNPWDISRSPGGSSGGATVAVAMGMGPIAVTTDGAGSARIPASVCGVLGLKPTLGRIPNETAIELFSSFINLGLSSRTVADLAAGLSVVSGACVTDPWSIAVPPATFAVPADPRARLSGLKALVFRRMGNSIVDVNVEKQFDLYLDLLRKAGVTLVDGPEDFEWDKASQFAAMRAYQRARLDHLLENDRDRLDPSLVAALEEGRNQNLMDVQAAPAVRSGLFRRVQALFDAHDLILTPTVAASPPPYDQDQNADFSINGKVAGPLRATWYGYTGTFNHTGHPAMNIPMGFTPDGIPTGLHVVGRWFEEQRLLDIAAAFEAMAPWAGFWPPDA